ncbi:MAG: hypothetical protein L6Q98_13595 [Anaerolineae bacterium]|nr:hypothetical protein [Anaerolineae bacterium]NUQ03415.1 hypothetical protein [Anaerolineae bacterium]
MNPISQLRNLTGASRTVFILVAVVLVLIALYAFFTSETGRIISIACCGGVIVLAVVGILSERGMRRPG